ncbi:DUF2975 domain-containing protein [Chryseobacterium sp.]|uniref:DUF2975 domain-containing protein n=1 Tax=Chryseobacterium sp. TaxID=1871047 RepID=UPI0028986108|nr:DUF2975 domain-containing protein [Chryseobacterium sp.]
MKLIGNKSLSTILNKILLIGCIVQLLYLGYMVFGFIISYINLHNGTYYFSDIFMVGNLSNGEVKEAPDSLNFRFSMPFTDAITMGSYTWHSFISIVFFLGFYSTFTFYLFRIFKGMSHDLIFNVEVIRDLKKFAVLNILFIPIYCLILYFLKQSLYSIDPMQVLLHFITGIIILFIMEFFKKGYELQTQNDLTI